MKGIGKSVPGVEPADERPDLVAWRRRNALRQCNAAQPVRNKRKYRRGAKHRKRGQHD